MARTAARSISPASRARAGSRRSSPPPRWPTGTEPATRGSTGKAPRRGAFFMGTRPPRPAGESDARRPPAQGGRFHNPAMTDTVLWTAFYVLIALVVFAVLVRF